MEAKTETLLREWGKWIRIGRPNPQGAKSWLGVMIDRLVQQNRGEGMILADDPVEKFDSLVMRPLKLNSPKAYEALEYYYSNPLTTVEGLGKRMKIRKQTASDLLNLARELVDELALQENIKTA